VAARRGGGGDVEELADLGPGEFLVAGVADGPGQELAGRGDQVGQGVQPDGGVAGPAGVRSRASWPVASPRTWWLCWPAQGAQNAHDDVAAHLPRST
jgi:hypothetical protein